MFLGGSSHFLSFLAFESGKTGSPGFHPLAFGFTGKAVKGPPSGSTGTANGPLPCPGPERGVQGEPQRGAHPRRHQGTGVAQGAKPRGGVGSMTHAAPKIGELGLWQVLVMVSFGGNSFGYLFFWGQSLMTPRNQKTVVPRLSELQTNDPATFGKKGRRNNCLVPLYQANFLPQAPCLNTAIGTFSKSCFHVLFTSLR